MANLKFHNQEFAANNNPSSVNSIPKPGTLISNSSSGINSSSLTPTISVTNVASPNGAAAPNPHQFSNYQHRDLFQVHCKAHNRRLSIKGSQLLNKYMTKKSSSSLLKTTSVAVLALLFCVFSSILLVHLILPNTLKSTRLSDSVGSSISPLHHTNLDDLQAVFTKKNANKKFKPRGVPRYTVKNLSRGENAKKPKLGQFGTFSGQKTKLQNFPVVIGKHFLNWLHAPTYSKNTKTN